MSIAAQKLKIFNYEKGAEQTIPINDKQKASH